jgi:hypothetical protein
MVDAPAAPPQFGNAPPSPPAPPPSAAERAADVASRVRADTADAIARGDPDPTKSAPNPDASFTGDGVGKGAGANKTAAASELPATVKIGDVELTSDEIKGLMATRAQEELRKTQIPASAAEYKAELPKDFKAPEGAGEYVGFNPADPMLADAAAWSHKNGLTQGQHSEMLSLYAMARATEAKTFAELAAKERTALGANATARVTAVSTFIRAQFGDEAARPILATLATRHHIAAFEKIMTRYASQGSADFSQAHRDPHAGNGAMTDAEWNSMSFAQKQSWQESQRR